MTDLGLLGTLPLEIRSIIYEASIASDKENIPFPTHKDRLFLEGRKEPVANRLPLGRITCEPLVLSPTAYSFEAPNYPTSRMLAPLVP